MILRRSKHDGMSSRTRFGRCNGSISHARTFRTRISEKPSRGREGTRVKRRKSSSHFAPKSLSFPQFRRKKKKSQPHEREKRTRANVLPVLWCTFYAYLHRSREETKTIHRERESLARKRSNNIPFVFFQEKCGFYCDAKMSEWNNKGRGAKEDRYTLHPKRFLQRIKIESSLKFKRHFEYTHRRSIIESYQQNLSFTKSRLSRFLFSLFLWEISRTALWFGKKTHLKLLE